MEESSSPAGGGGRAGAAELDAVCGICLSEGGPSVRGWVDSCDHYFCFVCIMEWAKIESRCPMCKQRFGSIRRPAVSGVFPRERVVRVPVRDQVYHLLGNATIGERDPYVDVTCTECLSSADEDLMLLCDLCDSGAHTYCIGLGATVPEGDWYCHDCTISRKEYSESQADDDCSNWYQSKTSAALQKPGSPISIYEILHDGPSSSSSLRSGIQICRIESNVGRRLSGRTTERESGSPQLHSDQAPSLMVPVREAASSSHQAEPTEQGARTLQRCRNLHDRIRLLRENWYALRSGSLAFTSGLVSSGGMDNHREHNSREVISGISRQMQSPSSPHNADVTVGTSGYGEISSCTSSRDVNKAWKMFGIAKSIDSIQRVQKGARSSYHSPNCSGKRKIHESKILEDRVPGNTRSEKCYRQNSFEMVQKEYKSLSNEKQKPDKHRMKEMLQNDRGTSLSFPGQDLKSTRKVLCHMKEGLAPLSGSGVHEESTSVSQLHDLTYSSFFTCLPSKALSQSLGNMKPIETLGCKKLPLKVNSGVDKNVKECYINNNDSAKSEVQSLVKLNLKLQFMDRHLGAEKFKEVARVATHTILAACGFQHSKSTSRPFSNTVCRHANQVEHLHRSNLMPSSCRECFFSFVKDVVDSVVSEKSSLSNSS